MEPVAVMVELTIGIYMRRQISVGRYIYSFGNPIKLFNTVRSLRPVREQHSKIPETIRLNC